MKFRDKVYAVIDTNVLVSSFFSKDGISNPAIVVKSIFENKIIPLYNNEVIKEYREVLSRSKFRFPKRLISELINTIIQLGVKINREPVYGEYFPDPKDIVFYEVKMAVDDSYLVTGNIKHFPATPLVVTPSQMVEILKEKGLIQGS